MRHVEEVLRTAGQRLLLVETSANYALTRKFYAKCGYTEEACIREYWDEGEDMIVFRKILKAD